MGRAQAQEPELVQEQEPEKPLRICGEFHHHCAGLGGWTLILCGMLGLSWRPARRMRCVSVFLCCCVALGTMAVLLGLGLPLRAIEELLGCAALVLVLLLRLL